MQIRSLFLLALAPLALASPEARPNPVAAPAPEPSSTGLLELLSSAEGLLTQTNVDNLDTIIGNAAKLLSDDNLNILQDILNNAHTLLTAQFVQNTTTLIGDATPLVADLSQLLGTIFT